MITTLTLLRLVGITVLGLALHGALHAQTSFKIGQAAPEFKAGRWLKHGPIDRLELGKIHVLEFWATWCGPCRAVMPHLTELARQHAGRVEVIGVNILERAPAEKLDRLLDQFIVQMGEALDYPVCRDTTDDFLLNAWFKPTRSAGIPQTVVVDAQGRVAWIGHPSGLDRVIGELLEGKFDYERSSAEFAKSSASGEAIMKVFTEYGAAMKAENWAKAIEVIDANPQYATTLWLPRFDALLRLSPSEAFEQVKAAAGKNDRNARYYYGAISRTENLPREMYQFAAEMLAPNVQSADLGHLAALYFKLGNSDKAVEYQIRLKDFALGLPQRPPPEVMEKLEEDLRKYRAGR